MPDFNKPPTWGTGFAKPAPAPAPSWSRPAPAPPKPPAVTIDKEVPLEPPKPVVTAPPVAKRVVPTVEPVEGFKPTVDMVIAPVRNYLRNMAPSAMPNSLRDPEAWEARAKEHKEELERELILIGLRHAIDWTE